VATVEEHYDNLLAPYYSWICGGVDPNIETNRKLFRDLGIRPKGSAVAVDLGAGCGFQAIPLAELGFRVIAVDTNRHLLTELTEKAWALPIATVQDNMLNFRVHCPAEVNIIVCMGDTLTHLHDPDEVQRLLEKTYDALAKEGYLVLNFRDMTDEMSGLDRFIPVKSDSDRIFACFLEYEPRHVIVHDIVYERFKDSWKIKKSAYRKLRLSSRKITERLAALGFDVASPDSQKEMVTIVARKP
jgi:SAM-dependent methyltransferase